MHIILLVANLALVLAFSLLCLSLLKVRNLPAYLIGMYIVAYADIVLVLEAASLMTALSSPAVLRLQVLLTVAVSTLWLGVGRPQLLAPLSRLRFGGRPRDWRFAVKLIPVVLVAGAVGYVYLRRAQWILAVVPNNYDSLTYHLSRVGYWLQYHSLYPWPTFNLRQTTFPMNAELGVLWTILWTGTDRLSGFVQWISVPAAMLGIYGLTRLLGYSRWSSAVTALLWPTLTQVLFQSSTTQNDLVTAAFWIIAVYYLVAANRGASTSYYALSGAAFGLAIGTKGTSLMVLPGFAVGILSMAFMNRRHPDFRRQFVRWTTACLLGFLLFGSYVYFQNAIAFGHFLGPRGLGVVQAEGGWRTNAIQLRDNLGRYAYQFVDFSPLPEPLAVKINPTKAAVFSRLFQWLRIPVENRETIATPGFDLQHINPLDEDRSWFGPLAVFLIAAVVAQAYQGLRRGDGLRLGLLIIGFGFVVVESAMQAWTPYKGRYFMSSVAVLLPFLGCLIQTRPVWRAVLTLCIVALGLVAMFAPTLNDPALKNIGWGDAFSPSRMKIGWPKDFQYFMVAKNISTNGSVGLTGGGNFQDYPFFGENFTHYVTLVVPGESGYLPRADTQRFVTDFRQSDYLLLRSDNSASITAIPPDGFELLSYDRSLSTWIRSTLRSSDDCDADKWPFRDFYQSTQGAAVCPQFPITPPRAAPNSGVVYVEGDRYVPVISSKPNGFLKFNLFAKEATRLRLAIQVDPQGFTDPQTLRLLLSQNNTEPQIYATQFRRKRLAQFVIVLPKGTSTMQLELADSPLEVRIMSIQAVAP